MRRGSKGEEAGQKESRNPTCCSACRGLPHRGEWRLESKKEGKKEKEEKGGRPGEEEQGLKTTFLHLQTFLLYKKALFN